MLHELQNGKVDVLSSQAHERSLASGDKLAVQFYIDVIAGTRKDSGIEELSDFTGKYLIYHQSAYYPQLDGLPSDIHYVRGYDKMLELMSIRDAYDAGVFSEPAYYFWMREQGLTPEDFGNVITIEADKEQWIFVRSGMPESLRQRLAEIGSEIREEGMYEALLLKYGKS